jgi:hypothetical protein
MQRCRTANAVACYYDLQFPLRMVARLDRVFCGALYGSVNAGRVLQSDRPARSSSLRAAEGWDVDEVEA